MAAMDVDDIWASMKAQSGVINNDSSVYQIIASAGAGKKERTQKNVKKAAAKAVASVPLSVEGATGSKANTSSPRASQKEEEGEEEEMFSPVATINSSAMMLKIARLVEHLGNSDDANLRKSSLVKLHRVLFEEFRLGEADYSEVFRETAKPIFKRFADSMEKCREVSLRITLAFFENSADLVLVLGYFIPALMQRLPDGMAFDEDMKVFVFDKEMHEAYRRGKAVDRQDKGDALTGGYAVVESSEELRLLGCSVLAALIRKLCAQGAASVLHPYFYEIIIFLQAQLRDPYAEVKIVACCTLEFLTTVDEYNTGLKFFAVGLVRAILPVLRHRHAKVRSVAVSALKCCMSVPDRAKLRGAGTEAIPDLVGFREDNVLQIAAFYKADVQVNFLAELVCDTSVQVREKLVEMLTVFLTEIGDRYDHQTRLLPYLLDLLTDDAQSVATAAMHCLQICGKQYEDEHADEIIERRQYGVDGDNRINLDKPLPLPFTERPRIGVRLYVRGNTKRFLTALVNELTNWVSQTRCKSANLLKIIVLLCEEHITMETHTLIPSFIKALGFAKDDGDKALHNILLQVFELVGRYVSPETYVHYILPRLVGDAAVTQFGIDAATRISVMDFLGALLSGSKSSELIPHFEALAGALTDSFVINPDSPTLIAAAMDVMNQLLFSLRGRGNLAIQAHFLATGRLTSLKGTIAKVLSWYLTFLGNSALIKSATDGLIALSLLESDSSLHALFSSYSFTCLKTAIENYDIQTSPSTCEQHVLSVLIDIPAHILQTQTASMEFILNFLCLSAEGISSLQDVEPPYIALKDLVVSLLSPLAYTKYSIVYSFLVCKLVAGPNKAAAVAANSTSTVGTKTKQAYVQVDGLSEEDRERALGQARLYLMRLLEVFIFSPKNILQSQRMQLARLEVLSVLTGCSIGENKVTDENFHSSIYTGEVLMTTFSQMVDEVINPAVAPGNSQMLRLAGVLLLGRMFTNLNMWWYGEHNLERLVKPFSWWGGKDDPLAAKRRESQNVARSGLKLVLTTLDDSSDEVRLASLFALTCGVALIQGDDLAGVTSDFSNVLSRILRETLKEANDDAFWREVEPLLRSLAVLNPSETKSSVLQRLESLPTAHPSYLCLSDVVDHCEMLVAMARK